MRKNKSQRAPQTGNNDKSKTIKTTKTTTKTIMTTKTTKVVKSKNTAKSTLAANITKANIKKNVNAKSIANIQSKEDAQQVAELASIIRVTNFTGTIRAWKLSSANEKESQSGPSNSNSSTTKPKPAKKIYPAQKGKNVAKSKKEQASILRRELRKQQEETRLHKVLQLNRKFLLNPILHIHFVLRNGQEQQNEQETTVRNVKKHKNEQVLAGKKQDKQIDQGAAVQHVRKQRIGQEIMVGKKQERRIELKRIVTTRKLKLFSSGKATDEDRDREHDPVLPILPDPNDDALSLLEEWSSGPKSIDEDSAWNACGEWVMDPRCSICGNSNHVDLPRILAVNKFHPDDSCVCCGYYHVAVDPCNKGVAVEPILSTEILL